MAGQTSRPSISQQANLLKVLKLEANKDDQEHILLTSPSIRAKLKLKHVKQPNNNVGGVREDERY